ncbi:Uncharacterised protein [Klebsiella pneumoniae]|nr:Uncharacterised protein [Klebsiella pneumoniae]
MVQHVHDVGATDAGRIVQARIVITAGFQLSHAFAGQRFHILFGAKVDCAGRTGFHAGRLLADGHAVYAQGTFVDAVVFRVQTRYIERTAGDTVAAADALLGLEVDNAVGVLNDRAF